MPESETRPFANTDGRLYRLRVKTALVLCFERLWPLLLPVLLLAALLLSLAWLGIFALLPRWLHLAIGGGCSLILLYVLLQFRHFQLPDERAVNSRIERENDLHHTPLQLEYDQLTSAGNDPVAQALWREHRRRMAVRVRNLRAPLPRPAIPQRDPHAVRAVIILLFASSAAYSLSPASGKISDIWQLKSGTSSPDSRIDAWLTPPDYTGKAPLLLSAATTDQATIDAPQGSILSIQINGSTRNRLTLTTADNKTTAIAPETKAQADSLADSERFALPLTQSGTVALQTGSGQKIWQFNIIADTPPSVEFTRNPTAALNGTLELHYKISDDYGITELKPVIRLLEETPSQAVSLTQAPEIKLPLPRMSKADAAEITTLQDLTMHPWAGKYVSLQLQLRDAAGQSAQSKEIRFVLPQRPFTNPLARAIAAERQKLALDSNESKNVTAMLDALTMHPQTTIANISHFLGIRSVRERLNLARNDTDLRNIVDYMWNVARGIEDGQLSDAEKALRAAQEALNQALQNNAGPEEIARLTQNLREAMNRYLAEMARRQQKNPANNAQSNANIRVLSQNDIDRMMQQIEDLARSGNHQQAQQLLSQLQEILNNLQPGQSAQGQGQANGAQQQLNKLGDLMRRQQELMNETFKLDQQLQQQTDDFGYNGEGGAETAPDNAPSRQETEQALKDLSQQQSELQNELNALTRDLQQQGLASDKDMAQAQRFMDRAGRSLGNGESGQATDQQAEALEALRRGARSMMEQMQQAQGDGQGQNSGQGQDPLGRQNGQGNAGGKGDPLPDQIDIQKARRILDEVRKKLEDALSPKQEKEYLERLLKKTQ